jgi:hypothetical protein
MSPRALTRLIALGRTALGGTLVVAPDLVTERWLGSTTEPVRILARGLGARDVALGVGTLAALGGRGDLRRWVAVAVMADSADALANAAAGDRVPWVGRWGTVALAGGAALAGLWIARAV